MFEQRIEEKERAIAKIQKEKKDKQKTMKAKNDMREWEKSINRERL